MLPSSLGCVVRLLRIHDTSGSASLRMELRRTIILGYVPTSPIISLLKALCRIRSPMRKSHKSYWKRLTPTSQFDLAPPKALHEHDNEFFFGKRRFCWRVRGDFQRISSLTLSISIKYTLHIHASISVSPFLSPFPSLFLFPSSFSSHLFTCFIESCYLLSLGPVYTFSSTDVECVQ